MTIIVKNIPQTYKNFGQHAEQALNYTLTGRIEKHDTIPYDKGSDIQEYHISVKSARFSLMSGNLCKAQDFEGIIAEYFENVASDKCAYVTQDFTSYIMDNEQFKTFLMNFCTLARESSRHGGRYKVKMRSESKKVLQWLQLNVA